MGNGGGMITGDDMGIRTWEVTGYTETWEGYRLQKDMEGHRLHEGHGENT